MVYLSNSAAILFGFSLLIHAQAFNFTHSDPTSCDDLNISWSGGTEPFYLTLIPVFGTPRNISIPSSSFSDGKGSFSTQLPFPEGQKMLLTMSDAGGFGTGGDTEILTAGASKGGSCNTTDPGVNFSFELNTALTQCRTFTFSAYDNAVQPVTIIGMIPGGDLFQLNPPVGPTSFDWTVNVFNGTQLLFMMIDSQGRQGGCSDARLVGVSDDKSCISADAPTSTAVQTTSTSTPTSNPESSSTSAPSSSSPSTGAIAGTVIGALVFLAVAISLTLFFLRRRQDRPEQRVQRHSRRMRSEVDLLGPAPEPYPYSPYPGMTPAVNTPATQMFPASTYGTSQHSTDPYDPDVDYSHHSSAVTGQPSALSSEHTSAPAVTPFVSGDSRSSQYSTPSQRKAAMAGVANYKPSRYVVHTDIEDSLPEEEQDEVIELPPQYRPRAPQVGASSAGPSSSNTTYPSGKQPFS